MVGGSALYMQLSLRERVQRSVAITRRVSLDSSSRCNEP
jgi:hypothetical protein